MKIVKDCIYGFIHIPELCLHFIDTPEFKRLHRIKQLGLAYCVYPSAVHTRFEHCLGVMHLTGRVIDHIGNVSLRTKELIQLAGLLHDIGHVAFSHLFDYILEEEGKVPSTLIRHEERSILLLHQINSRKKILSEREVEIVSKAIRGDYEKEEQPFLFQIVCNQKYGLDVDKLDYLQRDLYHTNMPCFQANYIIECMRVKDRFLHILKKAYVEVEAMYESRKRLLTLICRHKTVMKVEALLRKAISLLNLTDVNIFSSIWTKIDDYWIYNQMDEKCKDILNKIETRNFSDVDPSLQFEHIQYISREEINRILEKVSWL